MTWLEKMDAVINSLYVNSGFNPDFGIIQGDLNKKYPDVISKGEIEDILLYLYREQYIYCEYLGNRDAPYIDNINAHYLISCKGKLFLEETEGFVKQKANEDLKKQEIIDEMALRKKNERRLVGGTYLVAVGAIGLIIWEILKTFFFEHPCS